MHAKPLLGRGRIAFHNPGENGAMFIQRPLRRIRPLLPADDDGMNDGQGGPVVQRRQPAVLGRVDDRLVEATVGFGDAEANAAIAAFEQLQQEFRAEITVGVLTDAHRADLERSQEAMLSVPTVAAYAAAMSAFQDVCRDTASVVTAEVGIDFAANSRSGGCCG